MKESQKKALIYFIIAIAAFISVAVVNYVGKQMIMTEAAADSQQTAMALNIVMASDLAVGLGFLIAAVYFYKKES